MELIEEIAKEKICPHMTGCINSNKVAQYDSEPKHGNINCIASDCMAWRWAYQGDAIERTGFCGLAGRP